MSRDEPFSIEDVTALKESPKALLCKIEDEEEWIPLSQIHEASEVNQEGDTGTLIVSGWFARKKGWA